MNHRCGDCRYFNHPQPAEPDSDLGRVGHCHRARQSGGATPDPDTLAWVVSDSMLHDARLLVSEYFGCIQFQPILPGRGSGR